MVVWRSWEDQDFGSSESLWGIEIPTPCPSPQSRPGFPGVETAVERSWGLLQQG